MVRWHTETGMGWVRVFGWGWWWKDTRRHALLFSERLGFTRVLRVGPWAVGGLRRHPS